MESLERLLSVAFSSVSSSLDMNRCLLSLQVLVVLFLALIGISRLQISGFTAELFLERLSWMVLVVGDISLREDGPRGLVWHACFRLIRFLIGILSSFNISNDEDHIESIVFSLLDSLGCFYMATSSTEFPSSSSFFYMNFACFLTFFVVCVNAIDFWDFFLGV